MGCYASCLGDCQGGDSREHYVSRSVLELIGNKVQVSGFPWQQPDEPMEIGIGALTSKVLCRRHNSEISPLDAAGQVFLRVLKTSFDEALQGNHFAPEVFTIDGSRLERWLLKTLCGILAISGAVEVPDKWITILFGREPFPEGSGLHLFGEPGRAGWFFNLVRVITVLDKKRNIAGAKFGLGGLALVLAFGKLRFEEDGMQSLYRPHAILIENGGTVKRLEFSWPPGTGGGSVYLNLGGPIEDESKTLRLIVMPDAKRTK